MPNHRMTNQTTRRLGPVVALVSAATSTFAVHGNAASKPNHGGQELVATAQNYLMSIF